MTPRHTARGHRACGLLLYALQYRRRLRLLAFSPDERGQKERERGGGASRARCVCADRGKGRGRDAPATRGAQIHGNAPLPATQDLLLRQIISEFLCCLMASLFKQHPPSKAARPRRLRSTAARCGELREDPSPLYTAMASATSSGTSAGAEGTAGRPCKYEGVFGCVWCLVSVSARQE